MAADDGRAQRHVAQKEFLPVDGIAALTRLGQLIEDGGLVRDGETCVRGSLALAQQGQGFFIGQCAQPGTPEAVQYMGMRLPMGMCTGTNWALMKRAT